MEADLERIDAFCCYNREDAEDIQFILNELVVRHGIHVFQDKK